MHNSCSRPGIEPLAENQGRASPVIVSLLRECRPGELRVLLLPRDAVRLCEICDLQVETGAYSFEYFRDGDGAFPLMAATGEIAGQMAVIYAAYHLQSHLDGSGVSLPACIYAPAARVAVIGYGNAGRAAAKTALALGAEVTVYVRHQVRDDTPAVGISPKFQLLSEPGSADGLARSDVIIGALRISTFDTPPVVTADIVQRMRAERGSGTAHR